MISALGILSEGDHHIGVGVLINSLCRNGYQGSIWIGFRGSPPEWASPKARESKGWAICENVTVHLVEMKAETHLARQKPQFMLELRTLAPDAHLLFYCDTDIVLTGDWKLLAEWSSRGCLVVEHATRLSRFHPYRQAWTAQAQKCGYQVVRPLDEYINSGFIGLPCDRPEILHVWQKLLSSLQTEGYDLQGFQNYPSGSPWKLMDQAALNAALMVTDVPLSILDASAMDFAKDGFLLSHSAGKGKPWRGGFLRGAMRGIPPQKPMETWLKYLDGPIQVLPAAAICKLRISLRLASFIGRFYRHPLYLYYPG
jgi:hypothetical protein